MCNKDFSKIPEDTCDQPFTITNIQRGCWADWGADRGLRLWQVNDSVTLNNLRQMCYKNMAFLSQKYKIKSWCFYMIFAFRLLLVVLGSFVVLWWFLVVSFGSFWFL